MRYSSDLSDEQWSLISFLFERSDPRGARGCHDKREIINAILYVNKTGCQWRLLPVHFPPWQTVYDHFRRLSLRGIWLEMNSLLNQESRQKKGERPPLVI